MKQTCLIVASKNPVIIRMSFLSVVFYLITTPQKNFFNTSLRSKYKIKVIPIIYIIEIINIPKSNIK